MAVLNESIHRTRLYKVVGERRKKKEANRAVRLARMTLGQLSLKAVQRGATYYGKTIWGKEREG